MNSLPAQRQASQAGNRHGTTGTDLTRVAYFVAEDFFFLSHRLNLGKACRERGWSVSVATRVNSGRERIESYGIEVFPIHLRRSGMNPFFELLTLLDVVRVIARVRPQIVHLVGLKLILYGSLASLLFPRLTVVSAVSGLGTLFTSEHPNRAFLRRVIMTTLRWLLRRRQTWTIVQNRDDEALFSSMTRPGHTVLIQGAGVDVDRFRPAPEPEGPVTVAIVARMLGEKGVRETVDAARILKQRGVEVRIRLVGAPDPENPSSIDESELVAWRDQGLVEWEGFSSDVVDVWKSAHIALLPSHREGFPKALIEGMATGRPAITSDAVGCREVVEDGVSGLIVPCFDSQALADAIQALVEDGDRRRRMGRAARDRTEKLFSDRTIAEQTLALYDSALSARTADTAV